MPWDNVSLNVWVAGIMDGSDFYNARITNVGTGIYLTIEKNGTLIKKETYNTSSVDEVKYAADIFILSKLGHNFA